MRTDMSPANAEPRPVAPSRAGASPIGDPFSTAVILSAAKDLSRWAARRSFAALRMTDGGADSEAFSSALERRSFLASVNAYGGKTWGEIHPRPYIVVCHKTEHSRKR